MQESVSEGGRGRKPAAREIVDQKLRRIGRDRTKLEYETCTLLLEGERVGVHRSYGYASIREYAEAIVGLSPRETEERLRVARALETRPEVAAKFRSAELRFTAVRELSRVATAETERELVEAAGSKTARQIERLVAGHNVGDRPSDAPREEARRHRVVLDLSAQAFALLRDAKTELVKATGHSLDDDAFVTLLARALLLPPRGGKGDAQLEGETEPPQGGTPAVASNYRIGLITCPSCKKTVRTGGSEDVVVEPHVLEGAMCNAEIVAVGGEPARATQTIPPRIKRANESCTRRFERRRVPDGPFASRSRSPSTARRHLGPRVASRLCFIELGRPRPLGEPHHDSSATRRARRGRGRAGRRRR